MRSLWKAFGGLVFAVALGACGGGGGGAAPANNGGTPGAQAPVGPVTSVTVGGASVDITQPIVARNDQLVDVRLSPSGETSIGLSATLNGATTTATVNLSEFSGTRWAARIVSVPGSVFQMVVTQGSAVTTLTFNVESSFQGNWSASFTGGDSGSCTGLVFGKAGTISGQCSSANLSGALFSVSGTVSASGQAQFVGGGASTGATFTGSLSTGGTGSGTWVNSPISGTWTAAKQ
jgi:hypothetical protein